MPATRANSSARPDTLLPIAPYREEKRQRGEQDEDPGDRPTEEDHGVAATDQQRPPQVVLEHRPEDKSISQKNSCGPKYKGGMYGGSITAILIHTPGSPAAACTLLDGYPLTQQGKAKKAPSIASC